MEQERNRRVRSLSNWLANRWIEWRQRADRRSTCTESHQSMHQERYERFSATASPENIGWISRRVTDSCPRPLYADTDVWMWRNWHSWSFHPSRPSPLRRSNRAVVYRTGRVRSTNQRWNWVVPYWIDTDDRNNTEDRDRWNHLLALDYLLNIGHQLNTANIDQDFDRNQNSRLVYDSRRRHKDTFHRRNRIKSDCCCTDDGT